MPNNCTNQYQKSLLCDWNVLLLWQLTRGFYYLPYFFSFSLRYKMYSTVTLLWNSKSLGTFYRVNYCGLLRMHSNQARGFLHKNKPKNLGVQESAMTLFFNENWIGICRSFVEFNSSNTAVTCYVLVVLHCVSKTGFLDGCVCACLSLSSRWN